MKTNTVDVTIDCNGGNPASGDVSIVIDGKQIDVPITALSLCIDGADQTASLYLKFQHFNLRMKNAELQPHVPLSEISELLNPNGT